MKLVLICAGGTGGHIYPALSFAKALNADGVRTVFIGSDDRMESTLIPEEGYEFIPLHLPTTQGSFLNKVEYGINMIKAYLKCRKLLKEMKPDACVGFGNYISVPVILAASHLGIKTMISEQNSFAGKANVFLAKYAGAVELACESSKRDFDPDKTRVLGNPRTLELIDLQKDDDLIRSYGIDPSRPYVAVMMGSLGSSTMSKVIDEACQLLDGFQVLIAAGRRNDYEFQCRKENVKIVPYVNGVLVLSSCDLAVCRAGATTISELTMAGCASILIPSPFVPNNHQVYNAMELVNNGAALMIEEKDLSAERLAKEITGLMENETARMEMKKNAAALAKPHAAHNMVFWLKEICSK